MLFDSYTFIFAFAPLTVLLFGVLARRQMASAILWLGVASCIYYAWWDPRYLVLLLGSVGFNWLLGQRLAKGHSRPLLALGITANLTTLGYFKYAGFIASNVAGSWGREWGLAEIVLPIGISFFTFQQIAYLVDVHRDQVSAHRFREYLLFVSFFPQLIAGPIVHQREMLEQFARPRARVFRAENVAAGLTLFSMGLAKKILLADNVAALSSPIFDAVEAGYAPTFIDAWIACLGYTLQIYFDFSGYSDMAIGLGFLFGIRLPLNFDSPYRSPNIIEFWRRWHMTLSRFLRDYLYFSLGGNRKGPARRYAHLMVTMLLGGLWHGAGWNFVLWGGLHGAYLCVNHAWRHFRGVGALSRFQLPRPLAAAATTILTFLVVAIAWLFFRAESLPTAMSLLAAMFSLPDAALASMSVRSEAASWILPLLLMVWFVPNSQRLLAGFGPPALPNAPALSEDDVPLVPLRWMPTVPWAIAISVVALFALATIASDQPSEFLYYQF
jgi:D-alanyl-lipoteichoic acid acyltransferase DltB (MBOAT superfamily)